MIDLVYYPQIEFHTEDGLPYSLAKYLELNPYTLKEIVDAYLQDRHFRQTVNPRHGEVVNTFLHGNVLIENPDVLVCKDSKWEAIGGKKHAIYVPADGWITEFGEYGFPSETSPYFEASQERYGASASYLHARRSPSLKAIFRSYIIKGDGPLSICATQSPGYREESIGGRPRKNR